VTDTFLCSSLAAVLILSNFWFADWSHLPWVVFRSPASQWSAMPSFLVIEFVCLFLAFVCLLHSLSKKNLALWFSAGICGTANDIFFHLLPFSDNFWQAQACVMLTPRLPLYILAMYFSMIYLATYAATRLHLPPCAEAAATGLLSMAFYAPYDICGPKLLWWTWHDTDPAISRRTLGAPNGSTCWILTYTAVHALLLRFFARRASTPGWPSLLSLNVCQIAIVATCCTPLFMQAMGIFQFVSLDIFPLGMPGPPTLIATVVCLVTLTVYGLRTGKDAIPQMISAPLNRYHAHATRKEPGDRALIFALAVYYVALAGCMWASDPATHRSTGIHQTIGPCDEKAYDIMGLERQRYLCAKTAQEDYRIECDGSVPAPLSPVASEWYTLCGAAHSPQNELLWKAAVSACSLLGICAYSFIMFAYTPRVHIHAKKDADVRDAKEINKSGEGSLTEESGPMRSVAERVSASPRSRCSPQRLKME